MKHIFKAITDIEGKTVLKIMDFYEGVAIVTAEGFLFLKTQTDYEGDANITVEADRNEIMSDWSNIDLIKLGFTTQEELDAASQARKERYAKQSELIDRIQYEALKKRFGECS